MRPSFVLYLSDSLSKRMRILAKGSRWPVNGGGSGRYDRLVGRHKDERTTREERTATGSESDQAQGRRCPIKRMFGSFSGVLPGDWAGRRR